MADVRPGLVSANAADKLDKYPDNLTSSFVSPAWRYLAPFSGSHPTLDTDHSRNPTRMTETHISGW